MTAEQVGVLLIGIAFILLPWLGSGKPKDFTIPIINVPLQTPTTLPQKLLVSLAGLLLTILAFAPNRLPALLPSQHPHPNATATWTTTPTLVATTLGGLTPRSPTAFPTATMTSTTAPSLTPTATPLGGGGQIAVVSKLQSTTNVYLYSIVTGKRTQLPNTNGVDGGIAWSKDGLRLAFAADRGPMRQIYAVGADGSNFEQITVDNGLKSDPTWSPDNTQIAYESNIGTSDIHIIDLNTSAAYRAIHNPSDSVHPVWSPDGHSLAYVSWATSSADIYNFDLKSGLQTILLGTSAPETRPKWSPSGKYLAYTEGQPNGGFGIAIYDLDQAKVIQRIVEPGVVLDKASWSPDGKWLVMLCQYSNGPLSAEICRYDLANQRLYRMTNDQFYDDFPIWAP